MPHYTPLISTIVAGLVLAFVLAAIAQRLRISPLVGYLLAGVLLGPACRAFSPPIRRSPTNSPKSASSC
jgi:CPA2 family monovalent cation:H+ antiporter-2